MSKPNFHKFSKYYKLNPSIVKYLAAYVEINGITVACVLVKKVEHRFGIRFSCQWLTVILKSANIPRATRCSRKKEKPFAEKIPVAVDHPLYPTQPGLILFESLFMRGPGKVIAEALCRRGANRFVRYLGQIMVSGLVSRVFNYEWGMLPGVDMDGKSLCNAIHDVSLQSGLCELLNRELLFYWESVGIVITRLYGDGHTKIFFTGRKSLCGKISGSDRIAPGTRMVLLHQEHGFFLWLEMHRIDEHLGQPFVKDAHTLLSSLSPVVNRIPFIVDREGSGKQISAMASELGIVLLTLLNPITYKGLEDFVPDAAHPGLYRWASDKKSDDSRYFLPIHKSDRLLVFSINIGDPDNLSLLPKWYKDRWNGNENPLKVVNQYFHFNVNVGQGVDYIDHPKQIEAQVKAESELPKLLQKRSAEEKKNPRNTNRIAEKENRLKKLTKKIKQCESDLTRPIEKVAVKKTEGDCFLSIFKFQLYDVCLWLLMMLKWPFLHAQEVGFLLRVIFRRHGNVEESNDAVILNLWEMRDKKERLKQADLIKRINEYGCRTEDGKRIILKVFIKKPKHTKNSSFG